MPRTGAVAAVHSLLESRGFVMRDAARALDGSELACAIADGPLPLSLIVTLARRASFDETALIALGSAPRREPARAERVAFTGALARRGRSPAGPRAVEEAFSRVFEALAEVREGQLEMALCVWKALDEGRVALVEAGTGTGKSLAYLVPSALYARATGERVVVSTYTRNLQEQLYRREMPLASEILGIDLRSERLMGRENYLCSRAANAALLGMADAEPERALALAIHLALDRGATIDAVEGLPRGTALDVLAAPPRCPMNACGFAERCPLVRSRKRAREAEILFVNHALLFTDYRQGGAVIGPYARVVFDEAHNLERCVMENLSVRAARDDVRRILEPLKLGGREDETWKLLLTELGREAKDGSRYRRVLANEARTLEKGVDAFFAGLEESANAGRSIRSTRTRYADGKAAFPGVLDRLSDILSNINELNGSLKVIAEARFSGDLSAFQHGVSFAIDELGVLSDSLAFLTSATDEGSVFWLDWGANGSLRELCGSPMNVDRPFADYLETVLGSAVLTSATLSEEGGFGYLKDRLGIRKLGGSPLELIVPSPFPFDEHCLILIVSNLGNPNEAGFGAEVGAVVRALGEAVGRRTMVLFTSYRLCRSTAEYLSGAGMDAPVFAQGAGEGREALSERLRRSPNGVLLGVASFWEGVDFPGEELEVLVIPKIPFPVPTEPIVEARAERLQALGEDPFEKLFLPEAILRMRQGAGRLIRRMDDRGVVVILDPRLATRPYGDSVLRSLPSRNIHHVTAAECAARAAEWFRAR